MTVVELATMATIAAVGISILLAALYAAVAFGRLSQRVSQVEDGLSELRAETRQGFADLRADMRAEMADLRADMRADMAALRADMAALRADMERTNRTLVGLANHRHDTDGTTRFAIPQP